MPDNSDVFDYVIVGAGTAGSILTNRLSTDGARICLLEAGPEDYNPFIHIPVSYIKISIHANSLGTSSPSQRNILPTAALYFRKEE